MAQRLISANSQPSDLELVSATWLALSAAYHGERRGHDSLFIGKQPTWTPLPKAIHQRAVNLSLATLKLDGFDSSLVDNQSRIQSRIASRLDDQSTYEEIFAENIELKGYIDELRFHNHKLCNRITTISKLSKFEHREFEFQVENLQSALRELNPRTPDFVEENNKLLDKIAVLESMLSGAHSRIESLHLMLRKVPSLPEFHKLCAALYDMQLQIYHKDFQGWIGGLVGGIVMTTCVLVAALFASGDWIAEAEEATMAVTRHIPLKKLLLVPAVVASCTLLYGMIGWTAWETLMDRRKRTGFKASALDHDT